MENISALGPNSRCIATYAILLVVSATRQMEAVGDLPQIRPVVYGAEDNDAVDKDRKTRATLIEAGVRHRSAQKLVRLKYILSCQLQGSPPKPRVPVMSSIDSDHPLIGGRHAIGQVVGMLRNHWPAWAGLCILRYCEI